MHRNQAHVGLGPHPITAFSCRSILVIQLITRRRIQHSLERHDQIHHDGKEGATRIKSHMKQHHIRLGCPDVLGACELAVGHRDI